ncbi:Retinol dehydrogenase 13 [Cytospora mali]|uniref:Retinol dehydrogenase 13 n=1 Tax=Cytospora mali TaxID=578113 RepID=A0A194V373_CYTMA|nr:Retinol dehydrogenase 13 [Valsa mali var. pyri (nom. inval.)]
MVGSKDLQPSTAKFFPNVFFHNQYRAKTQWPPKDTNLSGQTAIITGSNVGMGYEAALQLLGLKLTHLIVAVRSLDKGEAAAATMRKQYPSARIEVWHLDLCSYDSIQAFAKQVETKLERIDMVILNAGRARFNYNKCDSTGHEESFQVNYLSTVFLTVLLLPSLKAKAPPGQPARLTIASAALTLEAKFAHREADPLFPALDLPENFDRGDSYRVSKLLVQMFLWKLVDYVPAEDVIINLSDPAFVKGTDFARDLTDAKIRAIFGLFGTIAGRSPKVGASCFVDAVVNKGKESHGCFLMSWNIHPFPAMLYGAEGAAVIDKVWNETLAEFEFAGLRKIIESMRIPN